MDGVRVADFDGAKQYASADGLSYGGLKSFTLDAWVYPRSQSGLAALMSKMQLGQGGEYLLSVDARGIIGIHRSTKRGPNLYAKNAIRRNAWSHVAAVYDGASATMSLYVNGLLSGEQRSTEQATAPSSMRFILGAVMADDNTMTHFFNGALAEVKVFSVAKTGTEIVQSMRGFFSKSGLAAYWPFTYGFEDQSGTKTNLGHSVGPTLKTFNSYKHKEGTQELSENLLSDFVAKYVCPNMCNGNGVCFKGRCACDDKHEGADCGFDACPNECSGHGVCTGTLGQRQCKCSAPYGGRDCSSFTCPAGCDEHGVCDGDGKCICDVHVKEGGRFYG